MLGETLLHYEILRKLGEGGMGQVYLARDTRLGREVALKILPPTMASDPGRLQRFHREAKVVAALNHPNIVTIHSVEEADGLHFFAMELIDGATLSEVVPEHGLDLASFLRLAIPITDALGAAHGRGITHRDLKPGNIMVGRDGRVKVLDFGLAKLQDLPAFQEQLTSRLETDFKTSDGMVVGTTPYMSPEQLKGEEVDHRSDIFSLGVVLYFMAAGKHPFRADTPVEVISAILSNEPPGVSELRDDLPDWLGRCIARCLEKDPSRRFQSVLDLHHELKELQAAVDSGELVGSSPRRSARRKPRSRVMMWAGLGALAALAIAGIVIVLSHLLASEPPGLRSVAVLPLANLTGDSELDYTAEALSAGLIGDLRQVEGVRVAPRATAWGLGTQDPRKVSDRLGVGAVVDGDIQKRGRDLSYNVELTDGVTGFVLWSRGYVAPPGKGFEIQDKIAGDVAAFLSIPITIDQRRAIARKDDGSRTAFDLYVTARGLLDSVGDPRAPDAAADNLRQALRLKPRFALAHVGLSEALWRIYHRDGDRLALEQAEHEAEAASRIDPSLPGAKLALARVYRDTGRRAEAVAEVKAALALHPRPDEAYRELARSEELVGELDDAEEALRAATALRPGEWLNWNALGTFLAKRGEYDKSRQAFEKAADVAPPGVFVPREKLATASLAAGHFEKAIEMFESIPKPIRQPRLASNLGTAYYFSHLPDKWEKAEKYYQLAIRLNPKDPLYRANLADLYRRLGREAEARAGYSRARELLQPRLEDDPDNTELVFQLADYSAKAHDCSKAMALARRLIKALPETGPNAHSMAYLYAMCGEDDAALQEIAKAIALGESRELIRREDEFRGLRGRPRFVALVGRGR